MKKRTHNHSRLDKLFNTSLNENTLCLLPTQMNHSHCCPRLLLGQRPGSSAGQVAKDTSQAG